jgi:hypothetical protein
MKQDEVLWLVSNISQLAYFGKMIRKYTNVDNHVKGHKSTKTQNQIYD